ncbi:MAG: DUF5107 domain-containing protein [Bacteroidales bacterium]|jgi:tetratricopeptide (TPR) repeat protein|nr:DUF5107 domain-containing protein [Bacteroidales bacterium]
MRKYYLLAFMALMSLQLFSQKATIYEEQKEMITYPFGDPDPIATPGKIYPYFRFDAYSLDPVNEDWNMICLENEWIKLWVAPELGGKVYGAMDKTNGEFFIYYNNVVKFRDIAMRGPWTSGGIEFNFGTIGHSPTTSSPVDYYVRVNPDSSVSCFVGALDLPGRTEWRVEICLPADKAWFETRTTWKNHSARGTSLYHWMNASFDVEDDLKYYFPGTNHIDHSGNLYPWPLNDQGTDLSVYVNNDFGGDHSYHVLGTYTDWFAGYYTDADYGFGHRSLYPLKPGKKIWMWALSRQGEIWKDLLTDTSRNKQYTEIQTGLLYNQAGAGSTYTPFKHLEFRPGSELYFTEKWFPLSKIGGVKVVSEEMALNIKDDGQEQKILLYALSKVKDTVDIVNERADTVSRSLDLKPADTLSVRLNNDFNVSGIYLRKKGKAIYREDKSRKILERPLRSMPFNWNTVYGKYYQALEYLRQRNYPEALEYVNMCIEQDPDFIPAYTKLAGLESRRFRYDKAEEAVRRVLAFNAYDPEANYIYAGLMERKGDLYRARDAYGLAMLSGEYYNICINKLALLALRENRTGEALRYIDHALMKGSEDAQMKRTRLVWARKTGNDSLFKSLYEDLILDDPLNHFARFENYLLHPVDSLAETVMAYVSNEFPYQTFLEMASWYINYHFYREAATLLEIAPRHPLIGLYLSYVYARLGSAEMAEKHLDEFLTGEIDFVFPFRSETEMMLRWAAGRNSSWKTGYYLALIYWNAGDRDRAGDLFAGLSDEPDDWKFYMARGDFNVEDNDIGAERDYREAYKLAPGRWRTNHKLINFYLDRGYTTRALELSTGAYEKFKGNYIIDFDHARCLLAKDSVYRCVELLEQTRILPHEGSWQGREVWKRANVLASMDSYWYGRIDDAYRYIENAYRWPENLGVGKPYEVDERLLDFVKAMVLTKSGDIEKARNLYTKIIDECTDDRDCVDSYNILRVFALRELNRTRESDTYFSEWLEQVNDERVKKWALSLYEGRYEDAGEYAAKKAESPENLPWEEKIQVTDLSLLHRVVKKYLQEKW